MNNDDLLSDYAKVMAGAILLKYEKNIIALLKSMNASDHDIGDVCQTLFFRTARVIDKDGHIEKEENFIITIAKNAYLDVLRHKQRHSSRFIPLDQFQNLSDTRTDSLQFILQKEELWRDMYFHLSRYKYPFQLKAFFLGYNFKQGESIAHMFFYSGIATQQEIAALLNIPLSDLLKHWENLPLDYLDLAVFLGIIASFNANNPNNDLSKKDLQNKIHYLHKNVLDFIKKNVK